MSAKKPATPKGLTRTAGALWRSVTSTYDLRVDELRVLEDACYEMALIDFLEEHRRSDEFELFVKGSQGQPVTNPVLAELRQHRSALRQLLRQLNLPDEDGRAAESRSSAARDAANARWKRSA